MNPNYPQIILSFTYRGYKVEIDRDELNGNCIYAAWVNHERGCAVAVPIATTTIDAIRRSKQWIDKKLK
ncbi:hypothetical protein [Myxosarcina sp. GI1]|uniref:hypothetical protein n=1 Tax=Myxosarcina sp. GI1 TaxID=1541065 RepID=UPI0009DE01CC|nr:hypothetical protein [Myxosarcina sp. GI1]